MERIKLLEKANAYRNKLGDINRQLAFAGIAIIWIFKMKNGDAYGIPSQLILAIKYIVISLVIDVFHFIWLAGFHIISHHYHDDYKKKKPKDNVDFHWIFPTISDLMLFSKVIFNFIGFYKIFFFLKDSIIPL